MDESKAAPKIPAAAAMQVVTRTKDTPAGSPERTEPPLKPNHPSHRRKTPIVASGILEPGIAWTLPLLYLPTRAPRTRTPARAAQPPTECTRVEPAKS